MRVAFWVIFPLTILTFVSAFVSFLLGVWLDSARFTQTGVIMLFAFAFLGVVALVTGGEHVDD
jgi:hypothetical protein